MCLPRVSSLFKNISPKTFGPHSVCASQLNALHQLCVRIEPQVHVVYTDVTRSILCILSISLRASIIYHHIVNFPIIRAFVITPAL
jgi:hypothetical protein